MTNSKKNSKKQKVVRGGMTKGDMTPTFTVIELEFLNVTKLY